MATRLKETLQYLKIISKPAAEPEVKELPKNLTGYLVGTEGENTDVQLVLFDLEDVLLTIKLCEHASNWFIGREDVEFFLLAEPNILQAVINDRYLTGNSYVKKGLELLADTHGLELPQPEKKEVAEPEKEVEIADADSTS